MREMSVICLLESPERLRDLPGFEPELRAAQEIFRDPTSGPHDILSAAFGVVDEYYVGVTGRILDQAFFTYSLKIAGQRGVRHIGDSSLDG